MHRSKTDIDSQHAASGYTEASLGSVELPETSELLRVGDIAEQTGKTVRAIHLYEQLGLLHPRKRTRSKYRLFGPEAVIRVRWIGKRQQLGMSLSDIRTFVRNCERSTAPGAMGSVRDVYAQHLAKTRKQLAKLKALEQELAASLQYLEGCEHCDPRKHVHDCHSCRHNSVDAKAPELIAGLSAQFAVNYVDNNNDGNNDGADSGENVAGRQFTGSVMYPLSDCICSYSLSRSEVCCGLQSSRSSPAQTASATTQKKTNYEAPKRKTQPSSTPRRMEKNSTNRS